MKFCVIIPCYNHSDTLGAVLGGLPPGMDALVVDDGSDEPVGARGAEVLRLPQNSGKAAALKAGFAEAARRGYTHAITLDADGQHDPALAAEFAAAAARSPSAAIVGVRDFSTPGIPRARRFMNRFSNFWFRAETGTSLRDTQCGFRCYPLRLVSAAKTGFGGYAYEAELLVKLRWMGAEIVQLEIPTIYTRESSLRSHYRPFADTVKFSAMNSKLFFQSLLLPRRTLKKLASKS